MGFVWEYPNLFGFKIPDFQKPCPRFSIHTLTVNIP